MRTSKRLTIALLWALPALSGLPLKIRAAPAVTDGKRAMPGHGVALDELRQRVADVVERRGRLGELWEAARRDKDLIRLNCVHENRLAFDARLAVAGAALGRLEMSRGGTLQMAAAEGLRIEAAASAALARVTDAEQCLREADIPGSGGFIGEPDDPQDPGCGHHLVRREGVLSNGTVGAAGRATVPITLRYRDQVGGMLWQPERVRVRLDGFEIFEVSDATRLARETELVLFAGKVAPGEHTLWVETTFRGTGLGIFTYMKGARQTLRAASQVRLREGVPASVEVTADEGDRFDLRFAFTGGEGRRIGIEHGDYLPCSRLVTPPMPHGSASRAR